MNMNRADKLSMVLQVLQDLPYVDYIPQIRIAVHDFFTRELPDPVMEVYLSGNKEYIKMTTVQVGGKEGT